MASSEKALNPVYAWLLGFSAMDRSTKFGMVSPFSGELSVLCCQGLILVVLATPSRGVTLWLVMLGLFNLKGTNIHDTIAQEGFSPDTRF
jgi:hypothetical protein